MGSCLNMSKSGECPCRDVGGLSVILGVGLVLILFVTGLQTRGDQPVAGGQDVAVRPTEKVRGGSPSASAPARGKKRHQDLALASDDLTFRPTVLVRRGTSQGSGTIIASLDGETLVLTAAHVLRGHGPISVELHRYNLGIEHSSNTLGQWPRHITAEFVGSDIKADLAIVRLRNMVALPFVARLGPEDEEPPAGTDLTSVGIDLGSKLSGWKTRLVEVLWFELNDSGSDRPFLVTARIPEHGRSGGGLYDTNGKLVGVCVGHAELVKGRRMGVFSSVDNVRQLLREHKLTSVIDRSEARQARLARNYPLPAHRLARPSRSAVTPTEARDRLPVPQP